MPPSDGNEDDVSLKIFELHGSQLESLLRKELISAAGAAKWPVAAVRLE
jgi:hypothetical protein